MKDGVLRQRKCTKLTHENSGKNDNINNVAETTKEVAINSISLDNSPSCDSCLSAGQQERNCNHDDTSSDNSSDSTAEEGPIVHQLNGQSYSLNPSRRRRWRHEGRSSWLSQIFRFFKRLAGIVVSPLIAVCTMTLAAIIYCSPQQFRNYLLSLYLPNVLRSMDCLFYEERRILLQNNITSQHRVLDIGCGTGAYLKFVKHASHIVALEPVKNLHPMIRKEAHNVGIVSNDDESDKKNTFTLLPQTIEEYFLEQQQQQQKQQSSLPREEKKEESPILFDWIILGNVLCEVECPKSTLETVNALLRPGGRVYFSEHIAHPCGSFKRKCQHFVNPWWNVISGGCNLNRDSLQTICQINDWRVISWLYSDEDMQVANFIIGPFVLGLAYKEKKNEG